MARAVSAVSAATCVEIYCGNRGGLFGAVMVVRINGLNYPIIQRQGILFPSRVILDPGELHGTDTAEEAKEGHGYSKLLLTFLLPL